LLFALIVAFAASIHLYREWGRVAMGPYAAGAVAASVLAVRAGAARARVWLAVFVFVGAALVPLGLEVAWRVRTSPGRHAQSEAIVTEEAAEALVHGKDPYATTYLHGPLADRPLGTKTHFPYLPGMLVFGLPRALAGHRSVADARVWFALTTLALTGASLALWRTSAEAKLHAVQWLVVLPTGALLMATGGDDLPVLALLLFALVLAQRDRPVAGGIALGVAAATKQTAWVLVPFLLIAAMANGRPAATKLAASTAAVVLPVIAAALAWNPGAFWEDAVRFPLGLGKQRTPAATPTIGSLIVHTFPEAKTGLTVALIGAVGILVLYLLVRRPPRSVAQAAAWAAGVFTVGYVFAPAARFGYVVYPIDLLVWASALGYRLSPRRSGR
jgi:hypothetical protein